MTGATMESMIGAGCSNLSIGIRATIWMKRIRPQGGLHLIRFNVAQTIYKELQLKDGNDYISVLRQDGSPALVSWYWSNGSFGRDEQSGAGGRVLEATSDFLIDLCNRYRSELIIELAMTRYKITYRYDYPSRDEDETCYRYVLFSPTKGLY